LFEEQRQIALDLKEQRTEMQTAFKEAEKTKQPIQQKIKEAEAECKSVELSRTAAGNNLKKFSTDNEAKRKELETLERQADELVVCYYTIIVSLDISLIICAE